MIREEERCDCIKRWRNEGISGSFQVFVPTPLPWKPSRFRAGRFNSCRHRVPPRCKLSSSATISLQQQITTIFWITTMEGGHNFRVAGWDSRGQSSFRSNFVRPNPSPPPPPLYRYIYIHTYTHVYTYTGVDGQGKKKKKEGWPIETVRPSLKFLRCTSVICKLGGVLFFYVSWYLFPSFSIFLSFSLSLFLSFFPSSLRFLLLVLRWI